MIRIACTALEKRIKAGRVSKSGLDFIGNPTDVTSDCIKAIIDYVGVGGSHVVTANGEPVCEIAIHALKSEVKEQAAEDEAGQAANHGNTCPRCAGSGSVGGKRGELFWQRPCVFCEGTGTLQSQPQQVNK